MEKAIPINHAGFVALLAFKMLMIGCVLDIILTFIDTLIKQLNPPVKLPVKLPVNLPVKKLTIVDCYVAYRKNWYDAMKSWDREVSGASTACLNGIDTEPPTKPPNILTFEEWVTTKNYTCTKKDLKRVKKRLKNEKTRLKNEKKLRKTNA